MAYDQQLADSLRENERLREGLTAAVRAANLALFVIRKQGVMPNSSWESGFEKDMAIASAALDVQSTVTGPPDDYTRQLKEAASEVFGNGQQPAGGRD